MTVEETKNTSTYEGDVILTQGSLLINADKLIIREDRPEFNIDGFAVAFFLDIKLNNTDKSLDIKDKVNDIVNKLLIDTDIR